MGRRSSIERLPEAIRKDIDQLLKEGRWTLDEILEAIQEEHPDAEPPSRSALGRYRKNFEEVAQDLRESRQIADVWAHELGSKPESDIGKVTLEVLRTLSYRVGADLMSGDTPDAKTLAQLGRAMNYIERAGKLSVEREQQVREEAARAAADAAEKVATQAGYSEDTIADMKRQIMGVA